MTKDQIKILFEESVEQSMIKPKNGWDFSKNIRGYYLNGETAIAWIGYYFCAIDQGLLTEQK